MMKRLRRCTALTLRSLSRNNRVLLTFHQRRTSLRPLQPRPRWLDLDSLHVLHASCSSTGSKAANGQNRDELHGCCYHPKTGFCRKVRGELRSADPSCEGRQLLKYFARKSRRVPWRRHVVQERAVFAGIVIAGWWTGMESLILE